jgi:hypothetical protein
MRRKIYQALLITTLVSALCFSGCAGGNRGQLPRTTTPTATELRDNWTEYSVHRWGRSRPAAHKTLVILYKLKNDTSIEFSMPWVAVTSAEEMEQSQILSDIWVRKILGQNDKLFGYMVHRSTDRASVRIIDENTIKLFYHFVPTSPR